MKTMLHTMVLLLLSTAAAQSPYFGVYGPGVQVGFPLEGVDLRLDTGWVVVPSRVAGSAVSISVITSDSPQREGDLTVFYGGGANLLWRQDINSPGAFPSRFASIRLSVVPFGSLGAEYKLTSFLNVFAEGRLGYSVPIGTFGYAGPLPTIRLGVNFR